MSSSIFFNWFSISVYVWRRRGPLCFSGMILLSGILPRGRDLYRVENGVAIQAPLLNLLNRKAGYINERLRYIASSLPRLTYTPHPRFVVDSVIQRSLLCKDGLHFSSRGSVQVVVDLEKDISTVRASLHAASMQLRRDQLFPDLPLYDL